MRTKVLSERPPSSKGELKIADPSAYKILNLENKTYFVAPPHSNVNCFGCRWFQCRSGSDPGFSVDQDPDPGFSVDQDPDPGFSVDQDPDPGSYI